jgi:hypothetical protein
LVLCDQHVEVGLGHGLGHPALEQPGLMGLAGDLLEPQMWRGAQVGSLRSPEIGEENTPRFLIDSTWRSRFSMNEGSVSAR